nr:3-oxo-tetronate kinase [Kibdelosporangium sp. MJ126-NF4]CEL17335.1 FIG00641944: hypothetical protein [Kibdelosporangium sp. MJ126-NF4]CTQ91437.1 FIG00641944: hypothetical protein [Kibdelosporangium sp. MJ126-NF4]
MIGTIADDYTGGTDVAVALRSQGLRTLLFFGVPPVSTELPDHDAVVVALKTRMAAPEQAVAQSLAALDWLRRNGSDQIYFKYCSTFDSTPQGNIGPVLDALADTLSVETVAMTPSTPRHRRTQYQGHLFVDGTLLAESHMRDHPVNPMRDSYLPRLLSAQTAESIGVLPLEFVRNDDLAVKLSTKDRYLLVDAIDEDDLTLVGRALRDAPLVAGAAGLARGLAAARPGPPGLSANQPSTGPAAVISGSCSARTLEQVAAMIRVGRPAYRLDPVIQTDPDALAAEALAWYDTNPPDGVAPLIYSSMGPVDLERTQEVLGVDESASILERASGLVAEGLVRRGVRRLIVAGGETSGAVVGALGVTGGVIGAEADTGVPWIRPVDRPDLALLLKSGNFGEVDLLVTASGDPHDP